MSTKKPATEQKVAKRIPAASQYIIPRDPSDPSSRSKFVPAKISLEKTGSGGFRLTPPGVEESIIAKQLEVVFLMTYPESQCRATLRTDTTTVVCYSKNRQLGYKGHDCKTQCPYAEVGKDKDSKLYRRPISKTTFFLARKKGSTDPFYLVRYSSVLDNISAVENIKDQIRTKLSVAGEEQPFYSNHIALINGAVETVAKGKVGRFSSEVTILEKLTDEEHEAVAKLNKSLQALNEEIQENYKKMTEERAKSLIITEPETVEEDPSGAKEPDTEKTTEAAEEKDPVEKKKSDKKVQDEVDEIADAGDAADDEYF